MQHLRWDKHGRTFSHQDEGKPNQFTYTSKIGQRNVDRGSGVYAPYVWDSVSKEISYVNHSCQFYDWYQVIRDENNNVLIDDQRFEVQYQNKKGAWRVLDLYQTEVTAVQNDNTCIVTRRLYDGNGSELTVEFLFRPSYKVKLTFRLTVKDAGTFRIRVQNTGIAGTITEHRAYNVSDEDIGCIGFFCEKIRWIWDLTEKDLHTYTSETQANGKKIDIFIGNLTLIANETRVISPDTWGTDVGIAANADDGDELVGTGWNINGSYGNYMQLGTKYGDHIHHMSLRWTGLTIAMGSTIDSCLIDIYLNADEGYVDHASKSALLYAYDMDEAPVCDATHLPSEVTKTTASYDFASVLTTSNGFKTISNTSVLQEIVNSYNTTTVNFLLINNYTANDWYFKFEDYSHEGTNEAELTITYTEGGGASSTPSFQYYFNNART